MSIRADNSALESIPLRLLIIAVVAALSLVPAGEALETLKSRDYVSRATAQLERIVSAAQIVAVEGPGSVRTLALEFTGSGSAQFRSLTIGDRVGGANMSAAVLILTNGARIVRWADDPPATLRSAVGAGLQVTAPVSRMRMSCGFENASWFVLVELV